MADVWLVLAGTGRTGLFAVEDDELEARTTARTIGGLVVGPLPVLIDFREATS